MKKSKNLLALFVLASTVAIAIPAMSFKTTAGKKVAATIWRYNLTNNESDAAFKASNYTDVTSEPSPQCPTPPTVQLPCTIELNSPTSLQSFLDAQSNSMSTLLSKPEVTSYKEIK